jgi:hypothetical protein
LEHVDNLNDALGGHSRRAEAWHHQGRLVHGDDKSVSEHVDDFEGKNKPDAWATVVSKSRNKKEKQNQTKKRGREGPPLSLWDRQQAATLVKQENKRLQGFCTSVYGTDMETGKKDNLSEAEWNRIQYPFQRLYREVIKQIQTYPIEVQVEAGLDLSDGENVAISRERFCLYHNREDGPSRDLSPYERFGHNMIFTIINTAQTVTRTDKIMLENMVITIENPEEDLRGITICMMEDGDWDALGDDTGEREDELVLILKQSGLNMDGGEEVERHFDKGSCH